MSRIDCFLASQIPSHYGAIQIDNPRLRYSLALFVAKPEACSRNGAWVSSVKYLSTLCVLLCFIHSILRNRYALLRAVTRWGFPLKRAIRHAPTIENRRRGTPTRTEGVEKAYGSM